MTSHVQILRNKIYSKAWKLALVSVTVLAAFFIALPHAHAQGLPPVKAGNARLRVNEINVTFDGPAREKARAESYVLRRIKVAVGEPFVQRDLDESAIAVSAQGRYEVTPYVEFHDDGVRVQINIRKRALVKSVSFIPPPPALDEDELYAMLVTEAGSYLVDEAFIRDDARRIRDALKAEGYYFAEVDYTLVEIRGTYKVVFKINAGPYVRMSDITFKGNEFFLRKKLLGTIESSVITNGVPVLRAFPWFMSPWFHDTTYVEERVESDAARVADLYHQAGFLDAMAFIEDKNFSDDFSLVNFTVRIHEGKRYHVRSISLKGNKVFTKETLMKKVALKAGDPLLGDKLQQSMRAIKSLYDKNAYIYSRVSVERRFDYTGYEVDLVFNIIENEKIYLEKIEFLGNSKTRDKVIRRELSIFPGEPFNMTEFKKSASRIFSKGYFSKLDRNIEDGSRTGWKKLIIDVEEQNTGNIILGFSYSSEVGLFGRFMLSQNNFDPTDLPESVGDFFSGTAFTGGGQRLNINIQPGTEITTGRIAYTVPYFLDISDLDLTTSLFFYRRGWSEYTQDTSGITLGFSRRVAKDYHFGMTFKISDVAIYDVKSYAPYTVLQSEGTALVNSVAPTAKISMLEVDRHSTRFGGFMAAASYELASSYFGSDAEFGRLSLAASTYRKIFETIGGYKHTLSLRGGLTWAHEVGDADFVPVYELAFLGGGTSLRGFKLRSVGPRENDHPTGGKARATASLEYSMPIPGAENNFRMVLFSDVGNLAEDWDTFALNEFRMSVGWGLRIKVARGLFAPTFVLDFGYPVRMLEGDRRRTFFFSFASSF